MTRRIWDVIFGAVSKHRGAKLEASLSELSPEEPRGIRIESHRPLLIKA